MTACLSLPHEMYQWVGYHNYCYFYSMRVGLLIKTIFLLLDENGSIMALVILYLGFKTISQLLNSPKRDQPINHNARLPDLETNQSEAVGNVDWPMQVYA